MSAIRNFRRTVGKRRTVNNPFPFSKPSFLVLRAYNRRPETFNNDNNNNWGENRKQNCNPQLKWMYSYTATLLHRVGRIRVHRKNYMEERDAL